MNKKNHGLSTAFKKSKILLLFGLIASLSACESSIINNKVDEKDTENTQERPDYDDMTGLVRYAPFSKNNNNFLVLNPGAYPKASAFKIEVKASEEMKDGTYEFVTIWENKITLDKPYLSIPKEFNTRNETKYAIMITALDGGGTAMAQGPISTSTGVQSVMEPSPPAYFYSMVTCNGPDYAYNLASFVDDGNNPTKYKIEMVSQRYSPDPTDTDELEIQYYQYMDETQFSAWEQLNPPVSHGTGGPVYPVDVVFPGELPPGDYYNSQNNVIQGPVYAVEKDFGQWKGNPLEGETALASPYYPHSNQNNWYLYGGNFSFNNSQDLIYFSSKINNDIIPEDSRYGTDLKCKQVKINGSHYGGVGSGTSATVQQASLIFKDCLGNIIASGDGAAGPNSDNVVDITGCGDEESEEGVSGDYGVYSINFEKIDEYKRTKPVTLYPERFKKDGYYYSLEEGLYNVKIVTKDQTIIRYLKRVNSDEEYRYNSARNAISG